MLTSLSRVLKHFGTWAWQNSHHLGVIAAIIAFFAWIVSSTISDWAEAQDKVLASLTTKQAASRETRSRRLYQSNTTKALIRIESRLPTDSIPEPKIYFDLTHDLTHIQFIHSFMEDIQQEIDFIDDLSTICKDAAVSYETSELETIQIRATEDRTRLQTIAREFKEAIGTKPISITSVSNEDAKRLSELARKKYAEARTVAEGRLDQMNKVNEIVPRIQKRLVEKSNRISWAAFIFKAMSLTLAGCAGVLEIAAKYVEAQKKSKDATPLAEATLQE